MKKEEEKQEEPDQRRACLRCKSVADVSVLPSGWFYCHTCRIMFDSDPDEGGDYATDPTRRIQRRESRQ